MDKKSLKHKALAGVLWSAVDKLSVKLIVLGIGIVLARLLSPSDFGLVGMLTIFMALSSLVVDSGFSQALVQKANPTQSDYSTAFFFNVGVGVVCYGVLFFAAPFVADFYQLPILKPLLRVMSLTFVVNSLGVVQRARLLIKIDLKTTAKINIIGIMVGGTVGMVLAYKGFGVWALAFQSLISQTTITAAYWLFSKWRPSRVFSRNSFRSMLKFGSKLLAAGTLATVEVNIFSIVIGKFYRARELGFYSNARQISEISSGTIGEIINTVTFPILCSIKEDQHRMIGAYSKMLSMTAFVIFPVMTLIAVLAEPFVIGVLTEKWLPAVVLIQWLCIARMFTPISALNMNILNAVGRSDLFMKLDFVKTPLVVLSMALTLPISVKAVVIGNFATSFICYFINAYLPGKMFGFGIVAQFKIFYKMAIATVCMALVTGITVSYIGNPILQLLVGGCVGAVSYWSFCSLLRVDMLREAKLIIFNLIKPAQDNMTG